MWGPLPRPQWSKTLQYSKKHFLTLVPELLPGRPGRSPQVANLSFRSVRVGGQETRPRVPSSPAQGPQLGRLPGRGGAGGGRPLPGGGAGAQRGWGRGRRAGAGVSLPPSLSPVKSRGAAGLSPVSSSCSLGRAAVTVHRRRRGLHRVRPPARQYGHHRHLHPLHRRLPAFRGARQVRPTRLTRRLPTLAQAPGRYAASRPAPPGPAPAAAALPLPAPPPAFPACCFGAP